MGLLLPVSFLVLIVMARVQDEIEDFDALGLIVIWIAIAIICVKFRIPFGVTITTIVMDIILLNRLNVRVNPIGRIEPSAKKKRPPL